MNDNDKSPTNRAESSRPPVSPVSLTSGSEALQRVSMGSSQGEKVEWIVDPQVAGSNPVALASFLELSRFWSKVSFSDGCWSWEGSTALRGYGRFWFRGFQYLAHRFAYLVERGEIPAGLTLDHLCRNRSCVNPWHLEAVTDRENVARGNCPTAINARRTECVNGHEFTIENTYLRKRGGRACRTCIRLDRMRRYYSA